MLNDLSSFSAAVLSTRMDAAWSYDQRSGRYRDEKGRFLSKENVGKLVDGRIDKLETQLKRFTRMLNDGSITLDQWQGSVREAIKAAHIQAATIGYGGRAEMGSAKYGRIGQRLRSEYTYGWACFCSHGYCSYRPLRSKCSWILLARYGATRTTTWIFVNATHLGRASSALSGLPWLCRSRYGPHWKPSTPWCAL